MKGEQTILGRELKRLRMERGWSQRDLADASGLSLSRVKGIETGAAQHPRVDAIEALAQTFNLKGDELLALAERPVRREEFPLISPLDGDAKLKNLPPAAILDQAANMERSGRRHSAISLVHEYLGTVVREERSPRRRRRPA